MCRNFPGGVEKFGIFGKCTYLAIVKAPGTLMFHKARTMILTTSVLLKRIAYRERNLLLVTNIRRQEYERAGIK